MKRKISLLLIIFSLSMASNAQNNELTKKAHRVVYQLANVDTMAHIMLIKQLNNLLIAVPDVTIEVVCHGPGLNILISDKTTVLASIQQLKMKGVTFAACENTMKDRKITKDQIIAEADYVPAAIVEIMKRQEEGWTYIKAGF